MSGIHQIPNPSCTTIVVTVQDVNGSLVTSDNGQSIGATMDTNTCTQAGGGNVILDSSTTTTSGKATFVFRSAGAYSGCTITFTRSGLSSVNATARMSE